MKIFHCNTYITIFISAFLASGQLWAQVHEPTSSISPERNAATNAAKGVLTRVMGKDVVSRIQFGLLQKTNGRDIYEYQASAETLTIRGSSVVAICRGAYDFLRAQNMGTVGWAGARLNIPE